MSKDVDDEYWGASTASRLKQKVNLFDESLDLEDAKRYLKSGDKLLDDDDDTINWDGSPAGPVEVSNVTKSVRYRPNQSDTPQLSVSALPRPSFTSAGGKPSTDVSITDVVQSKPQLNKQPTLTELAKLETEVNFLKRKLASAEKARFEQLPPQEMIRRIVLGQPYSLEGYKGKDEKIALVDEAIASRDGNAIMATVLFLKSTVKASIFQKTLMTRPVAIEHYITFLKQHFETEAVIDLLTMLGRLEEAAILKYKQVVSYKQAESKLQGVKSCLHSHFMQDPQLKIDAQIIQEQVNLLELQLPIQQADEAKRKSYLPADQATAAQLVGESLLSTLHYCCLRHFTQPDNVLSSPISLKQKFIFTDREYAWVVIAARSEIRCWKDIEELFKTKTWLGGTKFQAVIPFERLVLFLHKIDVPRDVLNKYCDLISSADKRVLIGSKCGCHESVLKTMFDQKDRQALTMYQNKLKTNSQEWFLAGNMLRNSSVKWKN